MATVHRKYNPDRVSDKVEGPFPLRLVRLCLRELYRIAEDITAPSGSGGGGGGSGLATRELFRFCANGPYRVKTGVDGAWILPTAITISAVWLHRITAGSASSTILDLNRNGTTLYTTQANRPTIAFGDADSKVLCSLPDAVALAAGDVVTMDIDQVETGKPMHCSLIIEGA